MKAKESFAAIMMRVSYGRTANVDDPANANADWRAGYAVGRYTDTDSFAAINAEWRDRGEPKLVSPEFREWKIGYWAGRFSSIDAKLDEATK